MEYLVHDDDGIKEVTLKGHLTFADHEAFGSIIENIREYEGDECVIDLENLERVDSAGLGMFVLLRDMANSKNLKMIFRKPRGQVMRMLEISEFHTFLTIEA